MHFGLAILMLALAGCALTEPKVAPEALATGSVGSGARIEEAKVLLLPPDLKVGEVGVAGQFKPRADWTEQAARSVMAALETKLAGRVRLERLDEASLDPAERADYERFAALARGRAVDRRLRPTPDPTRSVRLVGRRSARPGGRWRVHGVRVTRSSWRWSIPARAAS